MGAVARVWQAGGLCSWREGVGQVSAEPVQFPGQGKRQWLSWLGALGQDSSCLRALVFLSVKWGLVLPLQGLSWAGISPGLAHCRESLRWLSGEVGKLRQGHGHGHGDRTPTNRLPRETGPLHVVPGPAAGALDTRLGPGCDQGPCLLLPSQAASRDQEPGHLHLGGRAVPDPWPSVQWAGRSGAAHLRS